MWRRFGQNQVTVQLKIVTVKFIMWIEEEQITQANLLWKEEQSTEEHIYYGHWIKETDQIY